MRRDQVLLYAVVEVTLDPLPIGIGGQDEPLPGRLQLRDFGPKLFQRALQPVVVAGLQRDRPPRLRQPAKQ